MAELSEHRHTQDVGVGLPWSRPCLFISHCLWKLHRRHRVTPWEHRADFQELPVTLAAAEEGKSAAQNGWLFPRAS